MNKPAIPIARTVTRVTHTTHSTTRVTLSEEDVAQILRERYGMPEANVEFHCSGGYLAQADIERVVRTEIEEAGNDA